MARDTGNMGATERWLSILSGVAITLASLRSGGALRRAVGSTAGLSLLARGAAGHCGVKAALTGESSLREGLQDQWRRIRSQLGAMPGPVASAAAQIDSMDALYNAEIQELYSAESQLYSILQVLPGSLDEPTLGKHLRDYRTELRTRCEDLERLVARRGVNPRQHPDQAMRALLGETRKMAQVCGTNVRAAALIDSVQRLLHYKIAGYGTVANYAKTLGLVDDAARLAEYADRDKAVDKELTDLATGIVSIQAKVQPAATTEAGGSPRPH